MSEERNDYRIFDGPLTRGDPPLPTLSDEALKSIDETMKNPSLWPVFVALCERLKGNAMGAESVCGLLSMVGYYKIDVTKDPKRKVQFEEATKG